MMRKVAAMILALALGGPVAAQQAPMPCAAAKAVLPPELAAWTERSEVAAATEPAGLAAARIPIGKAVDARLSAGGKVHFADGPARAGEVGDNAGMFAFDVAKAGTYRVALGSGGWVDVLEDGRAVESSAHGHGPDCSGIVKIVDFPLATGAHVLQIEGSREANVPVLIVPLE